MVCEQLVVSPVQPANVPQVFGGQISAPRAELLQVPSAPAGTANGGQPPEIGVTPADSSESQYPGMGKLPYIDPKTKFRVKPEFLAVIRTLEQLQDKTREVFEYQELSKHLTGYILSNKKFLFDPRNIRVVICYGDPLGLAFGVRAFYRTQVMAFMRTTLIPLGEQVPRAELARSGEAAEAMETSEPASRTEESQMEVDQSERVDPEAPDALPIAQLSAPSGANAEEVRIAVARYAGQIHVPVWSLIKPLSHGLDRVPCTLYRGQYWPPLGPPLPL